MHWSKREVISKREIGDAFAASLLVTAVAIVYFTLYKVGNFLIKAKEQNQLQYVEREQ